MQLYIGNWNVSSWSLRVWLVMRHLGIPFEERLLQLSGKDWKRKLWQVSPTGRVPVLVDGDLVVVESLAIIEHLAERCPEHAIWPGNGNSRTLARAAACEMHAGFAALRTHAPMNLRASLPGGRVDPEAVREDMARIERLWGGLLDRSGGPFLFGEFTAADAMYAPVAGRILTYELPCSDAAAEYVAMIQALPAYQEWLAKAVLERWVTEGGDDELIRMRADGAVN